MNREFRLRQLNRKSSTWTKSAAPLIGPHWLHLCKSFLDFLLLSVQLASKLKLSNKKGICIHLFGQ